jgi:hypothetical protein
MDELAASLTQLLSNVILPNLKAVQVSQNEQIAANDRLEEAIEDLRMEVKAQVAYLAAQLTAARSEVAALHMALKAAQAQNMGMQHDRSAIIN